MIVLVTGGRRFNATKKLFDALDAIHAETPITLIISGACVEKDTDRMVGADDRDIRWALTREVDFNGRPARWKRDGYPQAGPMRNRRMLDELNALSISMNERKQIVACPGGSGTANLVMQARARGYVVQEIA